MCVSIKDWICDTSSDVFWDEHTVSLILRMQASNSIQVVFTVHSLFLKLMSLLAFVDVSQYNIINQLTVSSITTSCFQLSFLSFLPFSPLLILLFTSLWFWLHKMCILKCSTDCKDSLFNFNFSQSLLNTIIVIMVLSLTLTLTKCAFHSTWSHVVVVVKDLHLMYI